MAEINRQKQFFDYLIKRRGKEAILYDTMEVLNLGKGATYKRLNGDSSLSTQELVTLARHFEISLDIVFQPDRFFSFKHPFLEQKTKINFMDQFKFFLKPISESEEHHLTYLANELPVFYYFSHKYIFNFLLSIWDHVYWTDNRLVIQENIEVTQQVEVLRKDIMYYYDYQPVTEIWNSNMLNNLYQQIIFCISIKAFDKQIFVERLVMDIDRLINHLYDLCKVDPNDESKRGEKRNIYLNEFGNYLNLVLYESEKIHATFVGFDVPQFIVSHNSEFYDFSKDWINKIKKRSVHISGEAYQSRERFFNQIRSEYEAFKVKVDKLLAIYYE